MLSIIASIAVKWHGNMLRENRYNDAKHVLLTSAVNEQVLLLTAGLRQKTAGTNKLAPKWVEFFQVLERICPVDCKLGLAKMYEDPQ